MIGNNHDARLCSFLDFSLLGLSSGKHDIATTLIYEAREDKSEADGPITKVNPPRVIASTRDKRFRWNYRKRVVSIAN
jgi:hypothetical protein